MKATYGCVTGVQGEGKIDHSGKEGRVRGDIMLLASNPDRVRLDVISPFGVLLATLTTDGQQFSFFDMQNKMFLQGPPEPCNIARLTQVPIPAHALVKLMRGEAPLLVHEPSAATIRWSGSGYYELIIPSQFEAVQEIHLAPSPQDFDLPYEQQRLRVLEVKVAQRGFIHYQAELEDHTMAQTMPPRTDPQGIDPDIAPSGPACRAEVPRKVHVTVPYYDNEVRFRYKETGLNPPLPEGVFTQEMPGGVRHQYVTCH